MWLFLVGSGYLADVLRSRGLMSTTNVRKMMNGIGQLAVLQSVIICDVFLYLSQTVCVCLPVSNFT